MRVVEIKIDTSKREYGNLILHAAVPPETKDEAIQDWLESYAAELLVDHCYFVNWDDDYSNDEVDDFGWSESKKPFSKCDMILQLDPDDSLEEKKEEVAA